MRVWHTTALLAVIVLTTALGAVLTFTRRGAAPADGRIELTLGSGFGVDWSKLFEELCDRFNRLHPDVHAKWAGYPGSYYDKMLVMMAGRTAPDVMWMGQGFAQFAARDAFLDVEDEFDFDPEDYYMQVVNCYRFGGRLQGFPYVGDFDLIVYNVDMFQDAGIDPPRDDWTMAEFRRIAKRLTKRDDQGHVVRWGFLGQLDPGAFGAFMLNPDMTQQQVDQPQWVDYFNFILALRFEDESMPAQAARQYGAMLTDSQQFTRGHAAMITQKVYDLPKYRQTLRDFRWDIVAMPQGVRPSCWASTQGYAIWKHTRHPKQAIELLKFLVSPQSQQLMVDLGVPSHRATARQHVQSLTAPPQRKNALLQSMEFLNPEPRHPRLSELVRARSEMTDEIFERWPKSNRLTPKNGMQRLAATLEGILNRQYVLDK